MTMTPQEGKKSFVLLMPDPAKRKLLETYIKKHVLNSVVYPADDGVDALRKCANVPPQVVVTDIEVPKMSCDKLVETILSNPKLEHTAILIVGQLPQESRHENELVTGRVQFFHKDPEDQASDESVFVQHLMKALNFAFHDEKASFSIRFLAPGEVLIKEGDNAESVFIVKKGQLRAYKLVEGKPSILGQIDVGEFVGEMAYINGENRMANVDAVTDCELIEIPMGTFEKVLYHRPAWAKTLMQTLSKRLKKATVSRWKRSDEKE